MNSELTGTSEEPLAETPEDVAILYSWANLHGAKYRDFSASRREYRAQVRHRVAEEMRQSELAAKEEAEAAAAEAERVAREAERAARSPQNYESGADRDRALREAEDAARRAAAERVEAARRAEAAAIAEAVARREEREIAEAHASAQRQAASYTNSEMRRRMLAGPQPAPVPSRSGDPYQSAEHPGFDADFSSPVRKVDYGSHIRYREEYAQRSSGERRAYRPELEIRRRPQGYRPDDASGFRSPFPPAGVTEHTPAPLRARIATSQDDLRRTIPASERQRSSQEYYGPERRRDERGRGSDASAPAWLYSSGSQPAQAARAPFAAQAQATAQAAAQPAAQAAPQPVPLPVAREQVASRWFALKGFEPALESGREGGTEQRAGQPTVPPVLAVFSLAGGVGKTSLVATLGRALSSLGEKVLLADTTSHGLLPYYFGASELRPGLVRTFSPPSGSSDAPIYLVSYDVEKRPNDVEGQDEMLEGLGRSASGTGRILLDLNAASGWMIRRLARMNPAILVPVAPDMNSVISLQSVERYFQGITDTEGRGILPYYVLNQFDASLPLHLDVREVLRRQLGDRLLPFVVRRAPTVSEALAEGMTVVDYAPEAAVAGDYMNIAGWIRRLSAPATQGLRTIRWSER